MAANANPDEIKLKREDKARPILLQIKKLLDDNLTKVPPQSPLGKAVAYMLSHWQALNHYLLDGRSVDSLSSGSSGCFRFLDASGRSLFSR